MPPPSYLPRTSLPPGSLTLQPVLFSKFDRVEIREEWSAFANARQAYSIHVLQSPRLLGLRLQFS